MYRSLAVTMFVAIPSQFTSTHWGTTLRRYRLNVSLRIHNTKYSDEEGNEEEQEVEEGEEEEEERKR